MCRNRHPMCRIGPLTDIRTTNRLPNVRFEGPGAAGDRSSRAAMTRTLNTLRGVRPVVAAAAAALAVGTAGVLLAPTAGAPTGTSTAPQCSTADLSAQLKAGSPGAGQRFATMVLTNTSGRTCTVG